MMLFTMMKRNEILAEMGSTALPPKQHLKMTLSSPL